MEILVSKQLINDQSCHCKFLIFSLQKGPSLKILDLSHSPTTVHILLDACSLEGVSHHHQGKNWVKFNMIIINIHDEVIKPNL